jgi:hypothetical protein
LISPADTGFLGTFDRPLLLGSTFPLVSYRGAVGQPLRQVGAQFGGGDRDHPPIAEERRPVLFDPALASVNVRFRFAL